jgi:hypothetical protein
MGRFAVLALLVPWFVAPAFADGPSWKTGEALETQLDLTASVEWEGRPLRQALASLSEAQGVCCFLDRRVDPDQKVDLALERMPLRELLAEVARDRGLGLSFFDSVVYFGPVETTRRLRTVSALLRMDAQRQAALKEPLLATASCKWDELSEPRLLLSGLARQSRLEITNPEMVPHDLWSAADLPPLSLLDRIILISMQFDLSCRFEKGKPELTLIECPEEVSIVRRFPSGRDPRATAADWSKRLPGARISVEEGRIVVAGTVEEIESLEGRPTRPVQPVGPGTEVYTLSVEQQPLDKILAALGKKLGVEFEFDEAACRAAGIAIDQRVTFSVKMATMEDLLKAILGPVGLTSERTDKRIVVRPGR